MNKLSKDIINSTLTAQEQIKANKNDELSYNNIQINASPNKIKNSGKKQITPILKWVGGKRQLLSEINKYLPNLDEITYYEPFIGGGAVLFNHTPKNAVINDYNHELINMYEVVKNNVEELILELSKYQNTPEHFYLVRELDRDSESYNKLSNFQKASRLLYLNKTCFNGLFRVNKSGKFNTPFGKYKNPNIINAEALREVSNYFNNANIKLMCGDFENSLNGIQSNDFVYFDPPYEPLSLSSNFTSYTNDGFSRDDQIRLKVLCDNLTKQGVKFLLSNSSADFIIDLYKDYKIEYVKAKRAINSKGNLRGEINEILVRNFEL